MDDRAKTEAAIKKFFDAFTKLSPDEKRFFIAAIDKEIKNKDESEKKLYLELIKAVREGKDVDQVISDLKGI